VTGISADALRASELAICTALRWDLLAGADIVAPGGRTPSDCW
jgi:hypothetical protein